jgi:hypothetical protein
MMRFLLVATIALAVLVPSASAVTLVNPDGSVAQPYQAWANTSRVPTVSDTLAFYTDNVQERCQATIIIGCTSPGWIALAVLNDDVAAMRFGLMHELGHRFWAAAPAWKITAADKIRGSTDDELKADGYAECSLWRHPFQHGTGFGNEHNFRRYCKLIRSAN